MEYFCRQPKLYSDFQCMGTECPDNCCHGWGQIIWREDEYNKLCCAECSDELRNKLKKSFKREKNMWNISYDENGYCPMLTEKKLCQVQLELGVDYLSSVCQVYPRFFYLKDKFILRTCHLSCYKAMDMLLNDKDSMKLTDSIDNIEKINTIMGGTSDNDLQIKNNPSLKYRMDIFSFFYDIISNENYSVETALVLGALAAQQISKYEANKQFDKIPKVLEALKPQLNNAEQIKKIESISPNYTIKFNFVNELLGAVFGFDKGFDILYKNGCPSKEKYDMGSAVFEKVFIDRPFALRNIALNILTECFIKFYDRKKSVYENFSYIIACFACIKLASVAIFFTGEEREEAFKINSAFICRKLCHSQENVTNVLQYLKEHNCTSPAPLALLIK